MLAEEAHYMGEPCWHVCQYYERKRQARFRENMARLERGKSRAPAFTLLPHQDAVARHITGVWTDEAERLPVSWPCFECHNRYGHKATCSKYHEALRRI